MYTPPHFALGDPELALDFVTRWPFATLVTPAGGGALHTTHLPLLVKEGVLVGHMARANPHWRSLSAGRSLAIFHGPHAYVSPAWYTAPRAEVPTWNYAAVHVTGQAWTFVGPDDLRRLVDDLTAHFEAVRVRDGGEGPWRVAWDSPDIEALLGGIVGLRIPMEKVEAKVKLNQNKARRDRLGAILGLEGTGHPGDLECARLMREVVLDPS
jgi:transcriptional regulator